MIHHLGRQRYAWISSLEFRFVVVSRFGGQVLRLWDRLKPAKRSLGSTLSLKVRVLKLVLAL